MSTRFPQNVYVSAISEFKYTEAHVVLSIPPAAVNSKLTVQGNSFGFNGLGATGFMPSPVNADGIGSAYQVFAKIRGISDKDIPGHNLTACIGFKTRILESYDCGTFQYN